MYGIFFFAAAPYNTAPTVYDTPPKSMYIKASFGIYAIAAFPPNTMHQPRSR